MLFSGKGRVVWGVNYGDVREWGGSHAVEQKNIVLMSGAEKPEISAKFKNAGWEVKTVPGAGHKLLKVALGKLTPIKFYILYCEAKTLYCFS